MGEEDCEEGEDGSVDIGIDVDVDVVAFLIGSGTG